ncbi:MAG: hypothetical protein KA313_04675 [Pseudarcicella sp.]|nr:hypothetical protein [Pseudarcicella sp.]
MKKISYCLVLLMGLITYSCLDENEEKLSSNKNTNKNLRRIGPDGLPLPYDVLGAGYDVTGSVANQDDTKGMIIDMVKLKKDFNFAIEEETRTNNIEEKVVGENAKDYLNKVSLKYSAGGSFLKELLSFKVNGANSSTTSISSKQIYGSIDKMVVKKRFICNREASSLTNYLTDDFKIALESYSPEGLVRRYGTHVLLDVSIGGKIKTRFTANTKDENRISAAEYGLNFSFTKVFTIKSDININTLNEFKSKFNDAKFEIESTGGDPTKIPNTTDILNKDGAGGRLDLSAWESSIKDENSDLVKIGTNGLNPIYDFITDPIKKEAVKQYIDEYLRASNVTLKDQPVPIYQWYHHGQRDHYYTPRVDDGYRWNYGFQGVVFYAFDYKAPGTVPIFAFYHPKYTYHRLSQSPEVGSGENYLEIAFFAYPDQINNSVPIYKSTKLFWETQNTIGGYIKFHHYYYHKNNPYITNYTHHGPQFYAYY